MGKRRRVAQVAVPRRSRDLFAVAAPDQAVEHGFACAFAKIGMGDVVRDAALDSRLHRDTEFAGYAPELHDLAVGEAGGTIAEPGTDDAGARRALKGHKKHDIVGATQGAVLLEF